MPHFNHWQNCKIYVHLKQIIVQIRNSNGTYLQGWSTVNNSFRIHRIPAKKLSKIVFVRISAPSSYHVKRICSKLLHYAEFSSAEKVITTSLAHNKLKCVTFSRIISLYNSSHQNHQNSCSKCAPHTRRPLSNCRTANVSNLMLIIAA